MECSKIKMRMTKKISQKYLCYNYKELNLFRVVSMSFKIVLQISTRNLLNLLKESLNTVLMIYCAASLGNYSAALTSKTKSLIKVVII